MISKKAFLARQKGAVLVLVALSLLALLGVAALAVDLSHAYVNKTRLQNLADALALSAAISLENGKNSSLTAQDYAQNNTYPAFYNSPGNAEIKDHSGNLEFNYTFAVDYSGISNGVPASSTDYTRHFVRVQVTNMDIVTWFAKIWGTGFQDIVVSASAVAGPTPIVPCDNLLPILVCAKNGNTDTDCSDGSCYGYATNTVFCFKKSGGSDPKCPAIPNGVPAEMPDYTGLINGNFGWMDTGTGGKAVNDCLAGDPGCAKNFCDQYSSSSGTITAETGNIASANQGFNTRFDIYQGSYKSPSTGTVWYPDFIVGGRASSTPADNATRSDGFSLSPQGQATQVPYQQISETPVTRTNLYIAYKNNPPADANLDDLPESDRRVMTAPIIDCTQITKNGGKFTLQKDAVINFACLFITEPMPNGADQFLYAEIIDKKCFSGGKTTSSVNTGVYKIILYKDPLGGHS